MSTSTKKQTIGFRCKLPDEGQKLNTREFSSFTKLQFRRESMALGKYAKRQHILIGMNAKMGEKDLGEVKRLSRPNGGIEGGLQKLKKNAKYILN